MTWWNGDWKYRQEVKIINNAGKYLYGHQVLVTLTNSNFDFFHANTHGKDFRAVSSDGSTSYPYYIEKWDWGQEAKIWVRIPTVPPGESTFYIYYGNPNADSESSGITFDFFDDFEGSDLDPEKWTLGWDYKYYHYDGPNYSVSDSKLSIWASGHWRALHGNFTVSESDAVIVEQKVYIEGTDQYQNYLYFGSGPNDYRFGIQEDWGTTSGNNVRAHYKVDSDHYSSPLYNVHNDWHIARIIKSDLHTFTAEILDLEFNRLGNTFTTTQDDWTEDWEAVPLYLPRFSSKTVIDWVRIRKYADPEPTTELGHVDSLIIDQEFQFAYEYESSHSGKYTYLMESLFDHIPSLMPSLLNRIEEKIKADTWLVSASNIVHAPPFPFQCANPLYVRNDSNETLHDVALCVDLTPDTFDYACCFSDGANLKFVSADYSQNLPFWIEEWKYGGTSKVWVKLPVVPPGTNICAYLVYGFTNVNEMEPQRPEDIFLFYDGFEDGDISDWNKTYHGCYVEGWNISLSNQSKHGDFSVLFLQPFQRPAGCTPYSLIMKKTVSLPSGKKTLRFWHKDDFTTCAGSHIIKINDKVVFEESSDLFTSWTLSSSEVFEDSGEVEIEIEIKKDCEWERIQAYVDDVYIDQVHDATLFVFLGDKLTQAPLFSILREEVTLGGDLRTSDTWIVGYIFNFPSLLRKIFKVGTPHATLPFASEVTGCPTWSNPLRFPYCWTRRRAIIINNETGADIEDCQVYLELTPANFDYSHCNVDGSDIRFVNAQFSKTLPYFIEQWEYNGTSKIWIRVDKIPKGTNVCAYIYYDNPCTGTSESDASKVFVRVLPVKYWYTFDNIYTENDKIWTKDAFNYYWDLTLVGSGDLTPDDIKINTPWGGGVRISSEGPYWIHRPGYPTFTFLSQYSMAVRLRQDSANPDLDASIISFTGNPDLPEGDYWTLGIKDGKIFHSIYNHSLALKDRWSDIDTLSTSDWEDILITDNGQYRAYFKNGELKATHKNTIVNQGWQDLKIGGDPSGSGLYHGDYDEIVIFSKPLTTEEVKDYHENKGISLPGYKHLMFLRRNVDPLPNCSLGSEELATPFWDVIVQQSEDLRLNTTHILGNIFSIYPKFFRPENLQYCLCSSCLLEDRMFSGGTTLKLGTLDEVTITFGDIFFQKKLWIFALLEEYPELVTTFFNSFEETFPVSPNISITKPVHWTIRGAEVPNLISYKVTQEWAAPDTAELRFKGIPQFLMGDYIHIVYESGNSDNPEVTLFKGPVLTIDRELVSGREETIVRAVSNEWYLTKQNCFWGDESTLFSLDPNMTVRALLCYFLGGWDCNVLGWNEDPLCIWWNIPSAFEKSCENWRNTHPQWGGKNEAYKNVSEETWWSYWRNCSVGRHYKDISGILPVYFEEVPDWKEKYVMHAGKSGFNFFYGTSKWDAIMQICNVCDCVFFCTYWDKDSCRSNRDFGRRLAYFLTRNTCENVLIDNRIYEHPPVYSASDNGKFKLLINPLCRDAAIKVNDNPEDGNLKQKLISIRSREEQSSEETKINRLAVSCQDFPIVTVEDRSGNLKPVEEYISISDVDIEDLTDLQQFAEKRLEELRTPNVSFEARFLDFVLTNKRVTYEDRHCSYVTCLPLHTGMYIGFEDIDGLPQSSDKDGYYRIMKITYEMGEQTGGKILTTLECRDVDLIHPGSPKLNEIENIMFKEARKNEKGPILPGHPCPSNPRPPMLGEIPWMEVGEIIEFHSGDKTVDIKIHKTGQIIRGVPLL